MATDCNFAKSFVGNSIFKGSESLIVGKLLDEEFSLKVRGISFSGIIEEQEFRVPPKSDDYEDFTDSSFKEVKTNIGRLWAFLKIRNALMMSTMQPQERKGLGLSLTLHCSEMLDCFFYYKLCTSVKRSSFLNHDLQKIMKC